MNPSRIYQDFKKGHSRSGGNVFNQPLDSSAFVPDTALPPASMQAGFRRATTGILGGLFQARLYRLRPVGVPSRRINDGGGKN